MEKFIRKLRIQNYNNTEQNFEFQILVFITSLIFGIFKVLHENNNNNNNNNNNSSGDLK
jgi:hypothetical protein